MSKHHQHVKEVLKYLCKAGLYAKAEKCEFHSELVEYLGYILSPSGLTMSDNKIKIIQDWPEPKKFKDIQFFQSLPWLWPLLLSWLSKPHALYNRPLLPLAIKEGTAASPHAITASHGTTP